jgi:adenylate cyclase
MKKKNPIKLTIGAKLIGIISLLMILSLSAVILVASYFFTNDIELRIIENNHSHAEIIASKVNTDFNAVLKVANLVSSYMSNSEILTDSARADLERRIFINDRELVYIGAAKLENGELVLPASFFNERFASEYSLSRSIVSAAISSNSDQFLPCFELSHVVINVSKSTNHPMIAIGVPLVTEGRNTPDTIVIITMSMMQYIESFRSEGIIETSILGKEGTVLASSNINHILSETNLSKLPLVEMMLKSPIDNGQSRYKDGNQVEHLGSFKKIPIGGLGIIASVETEKAFQAVRTTLYRNLLILVIVLNIAVIIGFFFSKTITRPILKLVELMKHVERGDFGYRIEKIPNDELGILMRSFNLMNKGLAEREKIKSAFGKFVNKDIAEKVMNEDVKLGGERKVVTIFFSDIRSFTSMSERMAPEAVVSFLNEYMTAMVKRVNETGGVVDKFIGDAIMATWGTPVAHETIL